MKTDRGAKAQAGGVGAGLPAGGSCSRQERSGGASVPVCLGEVLQGLAHRGLAAPPRVAGRLSGHRARGSAGREAVTQPAVLLSPQMPRRGSPGDR